MKTKLFAVAAAVVATLVAGCTHGGIHSTPASESTSTSTNPSSLSTGTSTATTKVDSNPVKGTTFDACAAIADSEVTTWGVRPGRRDAHTTAFGQNVRGCIWDGPRWGVKVYVANGAIENFEPPRERWDRQERVSVGARTGWLLHTRDGATCSVVIPSQDALAAVQIDLNLEETRQRLDQCTLTLQIMRQIEPKIP